MMYNNLINKRQEIQRVNYKRMIELVVEYEHSNLNLVICSKMSIMIKNYANSESVVAFSASVELFASAFSPTPLNS